VPNDAFSLSALYRVRRKGADVYRGRFDAMSMDSTPLALDASTLGLDTEQSEHLLGLGLTFSTVRGYALREARWPLEVSLMHTQLLSGRGVPRQRTIGVSLRVYRPGGRSNPLRPSPAGGR
jgi:hypothetical protein